MRTSQTQSARTAVEDSEDESQDDAHPGVSANACRQDDDPPQWYADAAHADIDDSVPQGDGRAGQE